MKKFKILLTTLTIFALGLGISSSVFAVTVNAGGGTWRYGQRYGYGVTRQYSDYYHPTRFHRSTVYQNGRYYYSNDSRNSWYGGGTWSEVQGPWVPNLYSWNSYYAIR